MHMLPLTLATLGEECEIKKVGGNAELKKHLEDLGIVAGQKITVVSETSGNLIVNVKETRIALDRAMATKIMI